MTRKQTRRLVAAVQMVAQGIDGFDEIIVTQDEIDRFYEGYDDGRIGGEQRQQLAAVIRDLRKKPEFVAEYRRRARQLMRSMAKNPGRWRMSEGLPPRYYPAERTRKARAARRHRDCAYCGTGVGCEVCGECREGGIDGPVIRGTTAAQATTYIQWVPKKRPGQPKRRRRRLARYGA